MGFSTGRSAAKAAKRKAKQLEYIQKLNDRTAILREMRLAAGGIGSQTAASGVGLESSGGQGVRSSVIAQGAANYTLAREAGKLQKSMEKDIRKAKRGALKVKIGLMALGAATGGIAGAAGLAGGAAVVGAAKGAAAGANFAGGIADLALTGTTAPLAEAQLLTSNGSLGFTGLKQLASPVPQPIPSASGTGSPAIINPGRNINTGAFGASSKN